KKHDLALEINFDHTKYLISNNQYLSVRGIYQGRYIDSTVLFSEDNGFYYFLNNGANFFLLNIVKKYTLVDKYRHNLRVDFLPKVGIGPVVPHVENKLFGKTNDAAFQIGGWNMGVETAIRATFFKYGFLEFAQKLDYARYSNLRVYSGRAKQSFATYELILTAGITLPTGKNNSLFQL
ncbi:MAG: hypothetical protein EBX41_01260, partial [Chitinophagia bacterium]|nr:hypothetical protein [Chitinophagia bacterium]